MENTLRDIASAANVSVSTACRALNGHPAINRDTAARVRQAAQSLQYQHRRSHRRLDASRCLLKAQIGVLSLGLHRSLASLPIVANAIHGAEAALAEAGAAVHLAHVPDLEQPPANLVRRRLDGVVLVGPLQGEMLGRVRTRLIERLRGLPTVWLLGRPLGCWGDAVGSHDYRTGELAAEYLAAHGHRRLAFVNPKPDHLLFQRRENGFVAAARRLGAEVQSFCQAPTTAWQLPLQAPLDVEMVQTLIDGLLAARPRPTAIFAAADSVAVLVYRALAVRELRAGRDLSVISGNNDAAMIAGLHPRLTTFDVHAQNMGRLAVRQLAMRMSYPGELPESELIYEPTLVDGQSVVRLE